jgi:hypothetical protein
MEADIVDGPYFCSNKEFMEKVPNYSAYIEAAEEYMELHENYNYKDISEEAGRKKFEDGLNKHSPAPADFNAQYNDDRISYIISHKLIQKSVFATNDNCIFQNGNGETLVRGILYFTILEGTEDDYKIGIEYKVDVEVYVTIRYKYNEPTEYLVDGYDTIGDITGAEPSALTYSLSPTGSRVMVNGNAVSFDAYNINGSNYFKLRDLAMTLNGTDKQFEVTWDGAKNAINLTANKAYTAVGGELAVSSNPIASEAKMTASKVFVNGNEASFTAYKLAATTILSYVILQK